MSDVLGNGSDPGSRWAGGRPAVSFPRGRWRPPFGIPGRLRRGVLGAVIVLLLLGAAALSRGAGASPPAAPARPALSPQVDLLALGGGFSALRSGGGFTLVTDLRNASSSAVALRAVALVMAPGHRAPRLYLIPPEHSSDVVRSDVDAASLAVRPPLPLPEGAAISVVLRGTCGDSLDILALTVRLTTLHGDVEQRFDSLPPEQIDALTRMRALIHGACARAGATAAT